MRVLVTGGTGFIGRHLIKKLVENNYDIVVLARRSSDFTPLKDVYSEIKIKFGDIKNIKTIENVARNIDLIFHLAGKIWAPETELFETNILGTFNLLKVVSKHDVEKVIFTSSSGVYGLPMYIPITEEHPTNPINIYGLSKLFGEHALRIFGELNDFCFIILRLFNGYGSGCGGVIFNLVKKVMKGEAITIFGNPSRDFVYIDDIIQGLMLAAKYPLKKSEVFNICSSEEIFIKTLARKLMLLCEREVKIIEKPLPNNVIDRSVGSYKNAEKIMGYKPFISFSDGIKRYVKNLKRKKHLGTQ